MLTSSPVNLNSGYSLTKGILILWIQNGECSLVHYSVAVWVIVTDVVITNEYSNFSIN